MQLLISVLVLHKSLLTMVINVFLVTYLCIGIITKDYVCIARKINFLTHLIEDANIAQFKNLYYKIMSAKLVLFKHLIILLAKNVKH